MKWVIAQISYADMLKRVEPLRNELQALESEAKTKQMEGDKVEKLIMQLEKSIEKYKEEYGILISQVICILDCENNRRIVRRSLQLHLSCDNYRSL